MALTETQRPNDPITRRPSYKWAVVGMLWFICFFNYADRVAIASVLPMLQDEFGFTKTQQGLISSAFMWVYAFTAPFAGPIADRHPRKLVILAGLYAWSAITGFTALCKQLWHFVLVRGAEGLGETFYFPASMSLVSDYHGKETRSRAMSLHQTSVYAGTVGGGAITAFLAERYGWRFPFVFLGVAGIILGVILAAAIREPRRNEAEDSEGHTAAPMPLSQFLREMSRTPTALLLLAAFIGANFVAMVFLTWMPSFLKEKYQLSLAMAGLGAVVFIQTASMFGAVLGGFAADFLRRTRPGGRILVQAAGLFVGAPFVFLCGYTRDMGMLMVAMTLFGLAKGVYDSNIWASLYDIVPPSRRATAVGWMNMLAWVGGAMGPLVIGGAVDAGMSMSAAISSTAVIYVFAGTVLLYAATRTAPRDIGAAT
jgi:MFS family permease